MSKASATLLFTYFLSDFLHMYVVAPNDAVLLLLLRRFPRHMDGGGVDGVDLHVLRLSGHCKHTTWHETTLRTATQLDLNALSASTGYHTY